MRTVRLYYDDAYLAEFDARVVERLDDGRRVYLDRTAFYPTSGGQRNDLGALGGVKVIDVVDEEDRIAHVLDATLENEEITGVLDWARRFDHMQQHTGQHLLSAIFADEFGYDTASVHFGPDYATLDLTVDVVTPTEIRAAERRANELVTENRPVRVTYEDGASVRGLRKASEREGVLRVVTVDALDRSACGGTHVRSTGEVGSVQLRSQEKMKKNARIEFLCGARAVRRAREDQDVLSRIAQSLSSSINDLPGLVTAQAEQARSLSASQRKLDEELAGYHARERYAEAPPNADGVRFLVDRRPKGGANAVRAFALAVAELPRAVFVALCEEPRAVLVSASADSGVDAGGLLKARLGEVGGRGGGSPRLAQGSVPNEDGFRALSRSMDEWCR